MIPVKALVNSCGGGARGGGQGGGPEFSTALVLSSYYLGAG